jgi:uncharacterized FlaG/YvyC family protein
MNISHNVSHIPTTSSVSKTIGDSQSKITNSPFSKEISLDENKIDYSSVRKIEEDANNLFNSLNTGLALKFHEKSGEWYAVIENKLTREVIKEVPPKYILELHAKLKEMVGVFLDEKI